MNINAIFPAGVTALTVHGLHQWDYGRKLEIAHPDLPALLEVHFAAAGSREAYVRVVSGADGTVEVSIPDVLLEQSKPILAWVYVIGETSGETLLTVTMPVQERARPAASAPVTEEMGDKYTESLGAINDLVATLTAGNVTVAKAREADHATTADSATTATTAGHATAADSATTATTAGHATTATKAAQDSEGQVIKDTYCKKALSNTPVLNLDSHACEPGGVYLFRVKLDDGIYTALGLVPEGNAVTSVLFGFVLHDDEPHLLQMDLSSTTATLYAQGEESGNIWYINLTEETGYSMTASRLFGYPVG